jgi:hypothetical protein
MERNRLVVVLPLSNIARWKQNRQFRVITPSRASERGKKRAPLKNNMARVISASPKKRENRA